MDDNKILELYFDRSEDAVAETQSKYGSYCNSIAMNILGSREDSEECVNDTLLAAWNSIPPQRPQRLSVYLGKITRHLALNKHQKRIAEKRGGGYLDVIFDELEECIPSTDMPISEDYLLKSSVSRFVASLPEEKMMIFVKRYWYFCSVNEIAKSMGLSVSKIKVTLSRTRQTFKKFLEEEGISI